MFIKNIGQILIFFLLIFLNYSSDAKNYSCHYDHRFTFHMDAEVFSCEFEKINYGKNDTFNLILPANSPTQWGWIDKYIDQVSFIHSDLQTVPNVIFSTFQELKIFNCSYAGIKELTTLSFNKAENLNFIFLQGNKLTTIKDYIFVHTKKLLILDLSHNAIKKVEKYAFSSLTSLEEINLSNNKIKKIEADTFQSLIMTQKIWLSNNIIQEISSNIFTSKNEKLTFLNLENNRLTAISPYAFEKSKKLKFLLMKGNKCIDSDFRNWQINDNVGVKYELRDCFKKFKISHPEEERHYNYTILVEKADKKNEKCEEDKKNYKGMHDSLLKLIESFNITRS